jgi:hypothetical protein
MTRRVLVPGGVVIIGDMCRDIAKSAIEIYLDSQDIRGSNRFIPSARRRRDRLQPQSEDIDRQSRNGIRDPGSRRCPSATLGLEPILGFPEGGLWWDSSKAFRCDPVSNKAIEG